MCVCVFVENSWRVSWIWNTFQSIRAKLYSMSRHLNYRFPTFQYQFSSFVNVRYTTINFPLVFVSQILEAFDAIPSMNLEYDVIRFCIPFDIIPCFVLITLFPFYSLSIFNLIVWICSLFFIGVVAVCSFVGWTGSVRSFVRSISTLAMKHDKYGSLWDWYRGTHNRSTQNR